MDVSLGSAVHRNDLLRRTSSRRLAQCGEFSHGGVEGVSLVVRYRCATWHPDFHPEPVLVRDRIVDLAETQILDGGQLNRVEPGYEVGVTRPPLGSLGRRVGLDLGAERGQIGFRVDDGTAIANSYYVRAGRAVAQLLVDFALVKILANSRNQRTRCAW
jgi:hypothetical protein